MAASRGEAGIAACWQTGLAGAVSCGGMPLRPLLLPAMALAAVLGATVAAVLVVGDETTTHAAASAPAVTVTVDGAAAEAPATTAPATQDGGLDPAAADGQGDQNGQGDELTLPSLVGMRLDEATSVLDQRGLHRQVDGGGLFGVLDDSGWTVCATTPEAGADVVPEDVVIVHVDRSCARTRGGPAGPAPTGPGRGTGPGAAPGRGVR